MVCDCYLPDCPQCAVLWTGKSIFDVAEVSQSRNPQSSKHTGAERHGCIQPQDNKDGKAERHHCAELPHGGDRAEQHRCIQPACCCFLPGCQTCSGIMSSQSCHNSSVGHGVGRGNSMPARGRRLIAATHDELHKMIVEDGGWLAKGRGWDAIPCWRRRPHGHVLRW